jgi:hypothetical protein
MTLPTVVQGQCVLFIEMRSIDRTAAMLHRTQCNELLARDGNARSQDGADIRCQK